jgi:hypothetical protein
MGIPNVWVSREKFPDPAARMELQVTASDLADRVFMAARYGIEPPNPGIQPRPKVASLQQVMAAGSKGSEEDVERDRLPARSRRNG